MKFSKLVLTLILLCIPYNALADDFHLGFNFSVGVPSAMEIGLVAQPWTKMARFELAGAYNGLAPGAMGSITFTPIHYPMMPVLFAEGGFFPHGNIPSSWTHDKNIPNIGYDWVSVGLGLEFGNRDKVTFFIHPALTYIHGTTSNFQAVINDNNVMIGNPTVNATIFPTIRVGFNFLF